MPINDLVQRAHERRNRQSDGSLNVAQGLATPEQGSVISRLSRQTGATIDFVARNREAFLNAETENERAELLRRAPRLSEFVRNPRNAISVQDSLEGLAGLEGTIQYGRTPMRSMSGLEFMADTLSKVPGAGEAAGNSLVEAYFGVSRALAETDPWLSAEDQSRFTDSFAGQAREAGARADEARPIYRGNVQAGILGGAESVVQMAPGIVAGAVTRNPTIGTMGLVGPVFGGEYQAGREQGLNVPRSLLYGGVQGGIEYATERIPMGFLVGDAGAPVMRRVIGYQMSEQVGEQVATHLQDLVQWQALNPEKTLDEYLAERPDAAIQTAIATLVASGTTQGTMLAVQGLIDRERVTVSENHAEQMMQMRDQVEQIPVFAREREAVRDFIEQASDGATVSLEAEGIETLYQSDRETFDQLAVALEISEQQIVDALDGVDINIPVSVLQTIEDRAVFESALDITRRDENAFSPRQLREMQEADQIPEEYYALLEDVDQEVADIQEYEFIERQVREQLVQAGRSPQEAEAAGAIWGAMFRRLQDAGIDERQVFEQLGLSIQREGRQRRAPRQPQTLTDFVRRQGGIREAFGDGLTHAGGEIRQITGSSRKLINNRRGQTIDNLARAARDAGFNIEEDDQSFLDALDRDFNGDPVFRIEDEGPYREALAAYEANRTIEAEDVLEQASAQGYEGTDIGEAQTWLNAVAKGLDMSTEARMERARAMGFDTEQVLYHGTNADFESFKVPDTGKTAGTGIFLTESPSKAGTYTRSDGGMTIPVFVRAENMVEVDAGGRSWSDIDTNDLHVDLADGTSERAIDIFELEPDSGTTVDELAFLARDAGFSGIRVQNVVDHGGNSNVQDAIEYLEREGVEILRYPDGAWDASNVSGEQFLAAQAYAESIGREPVDTTVVFDPSNIRSVAAAFDPDASDSANLLAQSEPDQVQNLFIAHNTTQDKLLRSLELGGFPMPSLAVARTDKGGFSGFGEITFLADPAMLDERGITAYNTDIYSPTVPRSVPDVDMAAVRSFEKRAASLIPENVLMSEYVSIDEMTNDLPRDLQREGIVQLAFLAERNQIPSLKRKKVDPEIRKASKLDDTAQIKALAAPYYQRLRDEMNAKRREFGRKELDPYFNDDGTLPFPMIEKFRREVADLQRSPYDQKQFLRDLENKVFSSKARKKEFDAFAAELADSFSKGEKIFAGWTSSGNRKFKAFNLDNVMQSMRADLRAKEYDSFGGAAGVRARVASQPMRNKKAVQANRDKIVSKEEFKKFRTNDRLIEVVQEIAPFYKFESSGLLYIDGASAAIAEGPRGWRESFSEEAIPTIKAFVEELREMPTEYFEIKPDRVMQVEDFAVAVVPRNISPEVKDALKSSGIALRFYKSGDNADRGRVIEQQNDLLFQKERAYVQIPGALGPTPGAGVLSDEQVIVRLTEAADKTSFMHESAHIFLEVYAALEGQSPEIADQMKGLREWLDWKQGDPLTRDQHEKFAGLEGFEGYLTSGKAPSAELKSVFRVFRQWFLDVYKALKGRLIRLDPRAREFFDKMLASREDVEMARSEFASRASRVMSDIMTPEQVEKYQKQAELAGQVAQDKLFREYLQAIDRRTGRMYQKDKRRVASEVREELKSAPVYRAMELGNIDPESLAEIGGEDASAALERFTAEGGDHAEMVAADAGFTSADEMISAMMEAIPFEDAVSFETEHRMLMLYPEMNREDSYKKAIEEVFNDPSIRRMEVERDALAAKAARDAIPLKAIRARADQMINAMPIDEVIKPGRYAIKARDLHKKSIRLAAREQWEEALRTTHQAMLNHELARRAYKARDEVEVINRFLSKFGPTRSAYRKRIAKEYIEPIMQLISLPGSDNQFDRMAALRSFADEQIDNNQMVVLPTEVIADQPLPMRRKMTLDQLREYRDSVQTIYNLGKGLSEQAKAERTAYHGRLATQISKAWGNKSGPSYSLNPNAGEQMAKFARNFDSSNLALPFIAESFQGDKRGDVADVLYNDLAVAQSAVEERLQGLEDSLVEILDRHGITQKELNQRLSVKQLDHNAVTKQNLFSLLLNMGNSGNKNRIENDPRYGLSAEQVLGVLEARLEKRHFDAAQEIWDLIETQKPDLGAVHKRRTGVAPKWVEAEAFQTKYGTYRGGYYPISYDRSAPQNSDLKEQDTEDLFKQFSAGTSSRAQTKSGMLEARLEKVERPLDLKLDVLLKHFQDTAMLIEMSEPIDKAWQVISSHQVGETLKATHGIEYVDAVKTILKRTAGGGNASDGNQFFNAINPILRTFRVNAAVAILGWNVRTAFLAPVSYAQTVFPRYGRKVVMRGMMEFYGKPGKAVKLMEEKSVFMRERARTLNREAYDRVKRNVRNGTWSQIQGSGYWMMQGVEKWSVSGPLWHGVYVTSLEQGLTEKQAIAEADKAVGTTQGSGRVLDQTVMQSSTNELVRVFTFMMGYVSRYYGVVRNDVAKAKGLRKAFPIVRHLIIMNLAASMMEAVLRTNWTADDDEDDSYFDNVGKMFQRNILGMLPFVSSFWSKYDSGPAAMQFGGKIVTAGEDIGELIFSGEADADMALRAAETTGEAIGFGLGIPGTLQLRQIERTLIRDDDPEVLEAILTGPDDD